MTLPFNVNLRGRPHNMVVKFLYSNSRYDEQIPNDHNLLASNPRYYFYEHLNELYFRQLGFPVAMHIPVGRFGGKVHGILSENLAHAARLVEAHDFDFSKLKNGVGLKKEFNGYVAKMMKLKEKGHLDADRHISNDDPSLAFRKTFFVRYNAKTRRGQLVMGDLDQIKFTNDAFEKDELVKRIWEPLDQKLSDVFREKS